MRYCLFINKRSDQMANEKTQAYSNLKALLIRQGWNERAAALEAYRRIWPAKEQAA
jgi:hypothetical protein